jgi:hypothetical protein
MEKAIIKAVIVENSRSARRLNNAYQFYRRLQTHGQFAFDRRSAGALARYEKPTWWCLASVDIVHEIISEKRTAAVELK